MRNTLNHARFDFLTENFYAYKFYKNENDVKHLELRGFKEMKLEEGFKNKMDGDIIVEEPKESINMGISKFMIQSMFNGLVFLNKVVKLWCIALTLE